MRTLTLTLAGMLLSALALAGDVNVPGTPNSRLGADGQGTTWSRAKYDQLLGRLGLTDEQIAKIDAIYAEYDAKLNDFRKTLEVQQPGRNGAMVTTMPKEAWTKYRDRQKELFAERDAKIAEVLTAAQKEKFKVGGAIVAEFTAKSTELNAEYPKIRQQNGNDREKLTAAFKELSERRTKIYQEQEKQLDEKVGKLPPRPAVEGQGQGQGGLVPGQVPQNGLRSSTTTN